MTNDTYQMHTGDTNSISFGALLKSTREAQGLDRKDVGAQLRLNENVIAMLESDTYTSDLPVTFIRGYMRSYGKLLQVPEHEITKALELINPNPIIRDVPPVALRNESANTVTSSNYFVQFFTYLIALTMIGLVGTWWYTHNSSASENQQTTTTNLNGPLATPALGAKSALAPSISTVPLSAATNDDASATQSAPPSHAEQVPPGKEAANKPANNTDASTSSSDNNTTDTTDDAQ